MNATTIRQATPADASQICALYNHYVKNTCVTFEEDEVTVEDMTSRILSTTKQWSWLVAEEEGQILGYAYGSTWRARTAYRYTAESAIYLLNTAQQKGLGTRLYQALITDLKNKGYKVLVATLAGHNPVSEALHLKLGFKKVGAYQGVGYKHETWLGITTYQLTL